MFAEIARPPACGRGVVCRLGRGSRIVAAFRLRACRACLRQIARIGICARARVRICFRQIAIVRAHARARICFQQIAIVRARARALIRALTLALTRACNLRVACA